MKVLRLHGTLYACTPRYVSERGLDPLARFFYEVLQEDRNISRLTQSFGLPVLVIEDILAELVRKNYAMLTLHGDQGAHEIHPILNPQEPREYDDRPELVLWQDHWTGGLLPGRAVPIYGSCPAGAEVVPMPQKPNVQVEDFMTIADAVLVSLVRRIEPDCAFGDDRTWPLDRLVERRRIGGHVLYVPVGEVALFDRRIIYIEAPDIPSWMTRAWGTACQQSLGQSAADPLTMALAEQQYAAQAENRYTLNTLRDSDLAVHVNRWAQAAQDLLDHPPPVRNIDQAHEYDARHDVLRERLTSIALLRFRPAETASFVEDALRDARRIVVLVLADLDANGARRLKKLLQRRPPGPIHLCVLRGRPADERPRDAAVFDDLRAHFSGESEPSRGERLLLVATPPGLDGDAILVDGMYAWIGPPGSILSDGRQPLLQITGPQAIQPLLGLVHACISPETRGGDWVRAQSSYSGSRQHQAEAPLAEMLTAMEACHQHILVSIPDAARDERLTIGEALPELREELERAAQVLRTGLPEPLCSPLYLRDEDHSGLLAAVLRPDPAIHTHATIRIFNGTLGDPGRVETLVAMIRSVVNVQWLVELIWGTTGDPQVDHIAHQLALDLRANVPGARLVLRRQATPLHLRAVTFDHVVCIGTHEWLGRPGEAHERPTFSYVMTAPWLAHALAVFAQTIPLFRP